MREFPISSWDAENICQAISSPIPIVPFREAGRFSLDVLAPGILSTVIKERFKTFALDIEEEALLKVVEVTECHPCYTQYLWHTLWDITNGRGIRSEDVTRALIEADNRSMGK